MPARAAAVSSRTAAAARPRAISASSSSTLRPTSRRLSAVARPSADSTPAAGGQSTRLDAQLLGQPCGVHRAGAAEGDQRIAARVDAALDRHDAQRTQHLLVGDAHDPGCRLVDVEAELSGQPPDRSAGGLQVEPHIPGKRRLGAEVAEQQVGVRDGGLAAAASVGSRARHRARRTRADAQRAAGVGPGDAASTGPDGVDVDHRELQRPSGDLLLR